MGRGHHEVMGPGTRWWLSEKGPPRGGQGRGGRSQARDHRGAMELGALQEPVCTRPAPCVVLGQSVGTVGSGGPLGSQGDSCSYNACPGCRRDTPFCADSLRESSLLRERGLRGLECVLRSVVFNSSISCLWHL